MQKERKQEPNTETHKEFKNYLDRDLSRLVTNGVLLKIVGSVLKLFNYSRNVPYNSTGISIHFPFIQVAYIQKVIEYYNLKEDIDFISLLEMELPSSILGDLEADFYWCLSISFDSLKVKFYSTIYKLFWRIIY